MDHRLTTGHPTGGFAPPAKLRKVRELRVLATLNGRRGNALGDAVAFFGRQPAAGQRTGSGAIVRTNAAFARFERCRPPQGREPQPLIGCLAFCDSPEDGVSTRLFSTSLVAVALVAFGGCSGDSKPAESATSNSTSTSRATSSNTTSSASNDQDAAKAAYLAYWQIFDRVTNPPNPSDPSIAQYSVDPARADLIDGITTLQAAGQSIHELPNAGSSHHVDVVVDGSRANFTDCFVDARVIVDASGNTVNDKVVTKLLKGYLVVDGGSWKVAQYDEVQRRDGATGCGS